MFPFFQPATEYEIFQLLNRTFVTKLSLSVMLRNTIHCPRQNLNSPLNLKVCKPSASRLLRCKMRLKHVRIISFCTSKPYCAPCVFQKIFRPQYLSNKLPQKSYTNTFLLLKFMPSPSLLYSMMLTHFVVHDLGQYRTQINSLALFLSCQLLKLSTK